MRAILFSLLFILPGFVAKSQSKHEHLSNVEFAIKQFNELSSQKLVSIVSVGEAGAGKVNINTQEHKNPKVSEENGFLRIENNYGVNYYSLERLIRIEIGPLKDALIIYVGI